MRNMLRFLTNRKMLLRIILSYFFVGLLVIALLTVLITSRVTSDWTGELDRSTDRAIEQSYNTASILLKSAYDNYGTAFAGADIQSGFYNRDFSTGDLGRIGRQAYRAQRHEPSRSFDLRVELPAEAGLFLAYHSAGLRRFLRSGHPSVVGPHRAQSKRHLLSAAYSI
ncbi:hypothetical protein LJK87_23385 [Paenibacillus sp. P25]|nr:hypothetical protein LJK87_23385 [Paenibacillus sp. P25]